MSTRTLPSRTPTFLLALALSLAVALSAAACGDASTGPDLGDDDGDVTPPDTLTPVEQLPPTEVTRADLEPAGTVTEIPDGYRVEGSLTLRASDTRSVTFANADLAVRFDAQGRVRSISGRAEIPSPHERIDFAEPVRADIGFFNGKWLNENRELGLVLQEDTDYFVYDVESRLEMRIATGETGPDAHKPVSIRGADGRRVLMVVDYTDPMYYVHGQHDALGVALGMGWSLNQRIPFRPRHPAPEVQGDGSFDGGTIRTGTFPVYRIISVTGTQVDNHVTELHLNTEDPLDSELRAGYRQGHDGSMELDLGIKDMVGITIPLASASGAVWAEAGTSGVQGYAYASGETDRERSWWPTFLPVKPADGLAAHTYVTSGGDFQVKLEGTYGWTFPSGPQTMTGVFDLSNEGMTLEGIVNSGEVRFALGGRITSDATRVYVEPPTQLLDALAGEVNDQILPRIAEAEKAWNDLQAATEDYEFELSLRGVRRGIPLMTEEGKLRLHQGVQSAIASQAGKAWYDEVRGQLQDAAVPYYEQFDQLRAAAEEATDNAQTRATLERELRETAARKFFTVKVVVKDPVFSWITLYSNTFTHRLLTDEQAAKLTEAADNVWRIQETSDRKIRMAQVYETVNERELFEEVRDDLRDGVLQIRALEELGFAVLHDTSDPGFAAYVVIDGRTYQAGRISALSVAELMKGLPGAMVEALRAG